MWKILRCAQDDTIHESRRDRSTTLSERSSMKNGVSWLDVRLAVRMLAKYPGLTIVRGLGMGVAIAIDAGFFAFLHSHLPPKLPLPEGDRIIALENWNV